MQILQPAMEHRLLKLCVHLFRRLLTPGILTALSLFTTSTDAAVLNYDIVYFRQAIHPYRPTCKLKTLDRELSHHRDGGDTERREVLDCKIGQYVQMAHGRQIQVLLQSLNWV